MTLDGLNLAVSAEAARAAGAPQVAAAVTASTSKRGREYDETAPAKKKPCIKPSAAKEAAGSVSKEAAGVLAKDAVGASATLPASSSKAPEALHAAAAASRAVSSPRAKKSSEMDKEARGREAGKAAKESDTGKGPSVKESQSPGVSVRRVAVASESATSCAAPAKAEKKNKDKESEKKNKDKEPERKNKDKGPQPTPDTASGAPVKDPREHQSRPSRASPRASPGNRRDKVKV